MTATRMGGTDLLLERSFYGFAAAGVEVEERGDLVFVLGGGCAAEAGGGGGGALGDVGVRGDKLEEVEGDVFGAAGCALFHFWRIAKSRPWRVRVGGIRTSSLLGMLGVVGGVGRGVVG